jgi:hypothetical protein
MPEILIALHRLLDKQSLVWRATLSEWARWWSWRANRRYMILPREGNRFEIQFDEWAPEYPLALDIHRGPFLCSLPLVGPRTVVKVDELVYERRAAASELVVQTPSMDGRHEGLKHAVRQALDWETVTPLDELCSSSLSERVKKGLRWWKLQRTGTG